MNCQVKKAQLLNIDMDDVYPGGVSVDGTEFTGLTNLESAVKLDTNISGDKLPEETAMKLPAGKAS